jgi:hypothetical protein
VLPRQATSLPENWLTAAPPQVDFYAVVDAEASSRDFDAVLTILRNTSGKMGLTRYDERCLSWRSKSLMRTRTAQVILDDKRTILHVSETTSRVGKFALLGSLLCSPVGAGLGRDLVLQSAFGDSGHTTFFIKSAADFRKHSAEIVGQGEIKIMKRINCRGSAIEACATKRGTIVGPLMTELVGFPELTPYRGGWCGNEIFANAFSPRVRKRSREYTERFGNQLRKEKYRGYFELDFLIDQKTRDIYLGELNPRITGASSMTNHAAFAHADAPLFLFHLLEFSGIPFSLNIEELNRRWSDSANIDSWCQLIIKHTDDSIDMISHAPETGIWRMAGDGSIAFDRFDYHRRAVESEAEAFFLRIMNVGDYRYKGADLGILVTRGRAMDNRFRLTQRSRNWIAGIRAHYSSRPLTVAARDNAPTSTFKLL